MNHVINRKFYKGITEIKEKPVIPLKNSMVNNFGSHNMTVFYPNLCYTKLCYKGTALYKKYVVVIISIKAIIFALSSSVSSSFSSFLTVLGKKHYL